MLQPKKKAYAPYGSDKINLDKSGLASPKTYPKTRTMGEDKKTGKETITVTDSSTKKMLFSGPNVNKQKGGAKESNRFKSDSTDYANQASRQAEKFNIGKIASSPVSKNTKDFVANKKKDIASK